MGFSKEMKNLKITKGSKVGVECNWISKISQNIRKLTFVWEKKEIFSSKKNLEVSKTAKGSKFIIECNSISKISQNVQILDFREQDGFFQRKILSFLETANASNFAVESNELVSFL